MKDIKYNESVENLAPSGIRKFFDLANSMENVVSLGVGEPDFKTPWHIRDEAIFALEKGRTYYTANKGLLELRNGIINYYKRRFNVSGFNGEDNVIVTIGASEAIDIYMRTVLNKDDEVIILNPSYVSYSPAVVLAGGKVREVELKEENNFKLKREDLEKSINEKTKVLFLNYPSNPTGGVMNKKDYEEIIPVIKQHNLLVLSDEIYAELSYSDKFVSIGTFEEIRDNVTIINGFSKAYSMTGFRLGYIIGNKKIIDLMNKIHQYTIMSAPTISQFAAIEAINNGDRDCEYHKDEFEKRRNFIVNGLNRIGLKCHMPEGAFYVFPSIKDTGLTSEEFCERLLKEENVAVVPGSAFGKCGEGYIRISYAYSIDEIKIVLQRLEKFMESFKK